nr:hypothetical protein [Spirochaetota bacterium]
MKVWAVVMVFLMALVTTACSDDDATNPGPGSSSVSASSLSAGTSSSVSSGSSAATSSSVAGSSSAVASSSAGPDLRGIYVISDKSVYRIDLNASSASAIYTASATGLNMNSGCLALDKTAKKIYWIEQPSPGTKKIRRADLDGANAEDFHTFADQTTWYKLIGVDPAAGGKVYWYAYQKGSIYASDKNGSNAVALLSSATSYLLSQGRPSLDLANGRIVWMNGSAEKFYYISIAGGTTSDIVSVTTSGATQTANNLVVNPATGKMYWVSYWGASGNGPGDFRMADYPSGANAKRIDTNGG